MYKLDNYNTNKIELVNKDKLEINNHQINTENEDLNST